MIIWYEDEPEYVINYSELIRENGHDLVFFSKAKDLLSFVTNNIDSISLFIVDIMVFNPENVDGKKSGLKLLSQLSEIYIRQNKDFKDKVIVFTNCTGDSFYATYGISGVYKTLRKSEILPSEFLKMINKLNLPMK